MKLAQYKIFDIVMANLLPVLLSVVGILVVIWLLSGFQEGMNDPEDPGSLFGCPHATCNCIKLTGIGYGGWPT